MRYFDDKAVDPPKRKIRGEDISKSLAEALPLILFACREGGNACDDGKDKAADISCHCLRNHVQHVCGLFGIQDDGD